MLNDPIAVASTVYHPALNFDLIRTDGYGSERRDAAGLYGLVINHSTGKNGDRHYVKITKTINATNPYNALVTPQSASVSISFSKPAFGFTNEDLSNLYVALINTIDDADAGIPKIINFES